MKTWRGLAAVWCISMGVAATAGAMGHEIFRNDQFDFTVGGRAQLIGYAENVADPVRDNNRVFMFLKQARLNMNGHVMDTRYNTEWAFAAEDISTTNNNLTLLDFSFDIPILHSQNHLLRVGQFKVPYGRERLAYDGQLTFADRSVQSLGFTRGYDVGLAYIHQKDRLAGTFAVMTAGGRDVPLRFLPERLGSGLLVARIGFNDGVDKGIYEVAQNDLSIKRTQTAAYLNGLYVQDTYIGHDIVLDIQTGEKSLLNNLNWNPFLKRTPLHRGQLLQFGGDAVVRTPLGPSTALSAELELNHGEFSNRYGTIVLNGVRTQANVLFNSKFEIGLRYSALLPDDALKNTGGTEITGKRVVSEIVPGMTFYFRGHDFKLVMDAPVILNAPVAVERGVGSYVLTEQPDQTNSATSGMFRRTVTQARAMIQVAF